MSEKGERLKALAERFDTLQSNRIYHSENIQIRQKEIQYAQERIAEIEVTLGEVTSEINKLINDKPKTEENTLPRRINVRSNQDSESA